ncbi:hypothetical protein [Lacticaseibacillus suibinensis]|uniref:hypothetical protein n=3 Tax=Lacticaseibacillus suibinensis TaxID=2486011 RepID=UPI001945AFAA|nr:hypothetical protein [Lacticaseibacillus suibinensis]
MVTRADRYEFARHNRQIFVAGNEEAIDHLETRWSEQLTQLGFKMDMLDSVLDKKHQLPNPVEHEATKAFLTGIDDDQALGNAIFSMYRQITYWGFDEHLSDPDNRFWFATALTQLAALTQPLGTIQKVVIKSSEGRFWAPAPDSLTTQTLTLKGEGRANLASYFFSGYRRRQTATVPVGKLSGVLDQLAAFASTVRPPEIVCDAGFWKMTVTGEGGVQHAQGSMIEAELLSEQLRDVLPFPYLMLFDNAPNQLQRLVIAYVPDDDTAEKMVIDRHSQSFSLTTRQGATRTRLGLTSPAVGRLLTGLDSPLERPQSDETSQIAPNLTVTARYRQGDPIIVKGTLSLDDPIPHWASLAAKIQTFLGEFAPQMLDARVMSRKTPVKGELLYAQVVFHHGGSPYSYIADPQYAVGDRVVAPRNHSEAYGTIVAMAWYAPNQAPYPPAQTKRISRLADPLEEAEDR